MHTAKISERRRTGSPVMHKTKRGLRVERAKQPLGTIEWHGTKRCEQPSALARMHDAGLAP